MTFEELKRLLFVRGNFGVKLGLERMREACASCVVRFPIVLKTR
jgi:hypothetical protein